MRVLHVIDSLGFGGTERSLADLAPALAPIGVDVSIVQLIERHALADELRTAGFDVRTLKASTRRHRVTELRGVISDLRPSLVHSQLFEADLVGRVAAATARTPSVSSLVNVAYGSSHRGQPGVRRSRLRSAQAADIATGRLVRRFHAVSTSVADVMARRLLVPRHRIQVVPRGREADRLGRRTHRRRIETRAGLGLSTEQPMVLAVGRHEWQKGFDVLLEAVGEMRRPDIAVLIAGRDGNETDRLHATAARIGVESAVRFLGPRDDIGDLMSAADVLVMPSRREGLPGTLIEALALEVPVLSTRIEPVREVVADLPGVRLVDADCSGQLARALIEMTEEPPSTVGHRNRFETQFSMAGVARSMLDLYENALA